LPDQHIQSLLGRAKSARMNLESVYEIHVNDYTQLIEYITLTRDIGV